VLAGIYWIIRILSRLRPQEISFKGVKWDGGVAASVLHKHVDEIIHLFEMVPTDIVFVEDLDRFQDRSPFVRLREINFIVNSSAGISHPIRFIYALNDELFGREDKAKFFDIVIPVVPVINSDNSRDMFMSLLESRVPGIAENARVVQLVETVADYVEDLRQIKQMVNEFELYRAVLKGVHVGDTAKELAMVAIRCVYPRDYAALLKGGGNIRQVFLMFPAWRSAELDGLLEEQEMLTRLEGQRESDVLEEVSEMMRVVWSRAEDEGGSKSITSMDIKGGGRLSKEEFIAAFENIDKFASMSDVQLHRNGSFVGYANLRDILSGGNPSLLERIKLRMRPVGPDRSALTRINGRIDELRALTLAEAVQDPSFVAQVSEFCEARQLSLIPYLLRKGYLGADYADYIGYFYPGSMSRADKTALLALRTGKLLDVDVKFTSPALLLRKLSAAELEGGIGMLSPLFIEVIDDLGCDKSLRTRRIQSILSAVDNQFERTDDMFRAIDRCGRLRDAIAATLAVSPQIGLRLAQEGAHCSKPAMRLTIVSKIAGLIHPDDAGKFVDEIAGLLADITDLRGVLDADEQDSLAEWFKHPAARLAEVSETDRLTVEQGLRRNALQVTAANLLEIARRLAGVELADARYSELLRTNSKEILAFVKSDWRHYISSNYSEDSPTNEPEEVLLEILRISGDDIDLCKQAVRSVNSRVSSLASIDRQLWPSAFSRLDVLPCTENLMLIAVADELENENRQSFALALLERIVQFDPIPEKLASAESVKRLCKMLIASSDADGGRAASAIVELGVYGVVIEMGDATQDLMIQLVKAGLPWTNENFEAVRAVSDDAAFSMAISYFPSFLEYESQAEAGGFLLAALIGSSLISISERLKLFSLISSDELRESRGLSLACIEFLSDPGLNGRGGEVYEKDKVSILFRFAEDEEAVVRLLSAMLPVAPWEDVADHFARLDEAGFSSILNGGRRIEVRNSDSNLALLEGLRKKGIVGSPNQKHDMTWARVRTSKVRSI